MACRAVTMTAASASPAAAASRAKAASADSASATRPSSISATNRQNWPWRSRRSSPAARARSMISDPAASRASAPAGSHSACSRASRTSASVPGSPVSRASRSASSASARRRTAAAASPSSSPASRASTRARVASSPARSAASSSSRTRFASTSRNAAAGAARRARWTTGSWVAARPASSRASDRATPGRPRDATHSAAPSRLAHRFRPGSPLPDQYRLGEIRLAQPGQPQLARQPQRRGRGGDHRGAGGSAPRGHHREHRGGLGPAAVHVVDHDQPRARRREVPGRAVQVQRPRLRAEQPRRQLVRPARVAQQLRPDQASRLARGRRGPEHLEPAPPRLARRGLRQRGLARPRGAHEGEQAPRTARRAVQQPPGLPQLTPPPDDRHTPDIPPPGPATSSARARLERGLDARPTSFLSRLRAEHRLSELLMSLQLPIPAPRKKTPPSARPRRAAVSTAGAPRVRMQVICSRKPGSSALAPACGRLRDSCGTPRCWTCGRPPAWTRPARSACSR